MHDESSVLSDLVGSATVGEAGMGFEGEIKANALYARVPETNVGSGARAAVERGGAESDALKRLGTIESMGGVRNIDFTLLSAAALVRLLQQRSSSKMANAREAYGLAGAGGEGSVSLASQSLTRDSEMESVLARDTAASKRDTLAVNSELVLPRFLAMGHLGCELNFSPAVPTNVLADGSRLDASQLVGLSRRTGLLERAPNMSTLHLHGGRAGTMGAVEPSIEQLTTQSVEAFSQVGYAREGQSAYHARWSRKVDNYFSVFATTLDMDRAIVNLQTVLPGSFLSRAEALCALADVDGNRFEAAAKLRVTGYLNEVPPLSITLPPTHPTYPVLSSRQYHPRDPTLFSSFVL
jgi:hypothetical protein